MYWFAEGKTAIQRDKEVNYLGQNKLREVETCNSVPVAYVQRAGFQPVYLVILTGIIHKNKNYFVE